MLSDYCCSTHSFLCILLQKEMKKKTIYECKYITTIKYNLSEKAERIEIKKKHRGNLQMDLF